MKTILATLLVTASLATPIAIAGHHDGGFPGLPDAALFGICTAYENNENGREHGNAGNAPPFAWLGDQADAEDQTVEEYCAENAQHPGQGKGQGGAQSERAPPALP